MLVWTKCFHKKNRHSFVGKKVIHKIRPRDDPVRVYNRDLAISSSTVSTASSSRSAEPATTNVHSSKSHLLHKQQIQVRFLLFFFK
jgi:hypothetical protein